MVKKAFLISNMHCSNCAMKIEGLEDELAGIKRISASYHKQQMEVEFDEALLSIEQIINAVKDLGYEAIPAS